MRDRNVNGSNRFKASGILASLFVLGSVLSLGLAAPTSDLPSTKGKPQPSPVTDPTQAGEIKGTLTDCGTAGAQGMEVYIPGRSFFVRTGPEGTFTIHYVPAGTWTLVLSRQGQNIRQIPGVKVNAHALTDLGSVPVHLDSDGDGFSTEFDCDDGDPSVYPGASELCDGKDNDCDGETDEGVGNWYYRDNDGDGYGDPGQAIQACTPPAGYVENGMDCADSDPTTHPGAGELMDGKDNDCDGQIDECDGLLLYRDLDDDGFGDPENSICSESPVPGYVEDGGDCADYDPTIHPGALDICDGKDNDCDGWIDEDEISWWPDADGDGFGDAAADPQRCAGSSGGPLGHVPNGLDCNDADPEIHPGAEDVAGDGIDSDCDGYDG